MSRSLSTPFLTALAANLVRPAFLVQITFKSGVRYAWSGPGPLAYNGNTYLGVGSLGTISIINEGSDLTAEGTSVALSGIDPDLQNECLNDIQLGAPAKILFALLDQNMSVIDTAVLFAGTVDKPSFQIGPDTIGISLALEDRLLDLQRASMWRYTAADQRLNYPDDTGFNFVEQLNDIALRWGN